MLWLLRFLVFCPLLTVASAHARQLELGSVDFPTSGSGQAQEHFLRAVAALHSFWYPVALKEFRAAHYILHAFDDPNHAILALPAARQYAEIAPDAPHALHMPSHIFLQLGMWEEAAKSNEASWAASTKWVEQNNLSIAKRDYHSLDWLLYTYLQQGRHDDAEALLKLMQKSLAEGPQNDPMFQGYGTFIYASMASAFVIETERWELVDKLFAPLQKNTQLRSAAEKPGPFQALAKYVQALAIYTPGFSAAKQGSPDAQKSITELQAMREQAGKEVVPALGMSLSNLLEIQRLEIAAAASAVKGDLAEAIKTLQKATAVEESIEPPPGPPPLIKASPELAGEILLQAKRPKDAAEEFSTSLLRHDDRAHSLIGSARAAAQSGDHASALAAYSEFVRHWKGDKSQPGPREAQDFLARAR